MEFSQLIFLGLLVFAGTGNSFIISQNKTDRKSKIEGGESISIEKIPYQVMLEERGELICGGALITPNIVLTAAHCFDDLKSPNELTVIAGTDSTDYDEESVQLVAETITTHPMYNNKSEELALKYDIAIIKLKEPFMMTKKISTIELAVSGVQKGEELLLAGTGVVDDILTDSSCLKAYKPKVVGCEEYIHHYITSYDGIICHKNDEGFRSRLGDSGGPLVNSRGQLVGVHRGTRDVIIQTGVDVLFQLEWIRSEVALQTNELI